MASETPQAGPAGRALLPGARAAAYLLPATPAATTCGHWLDAATARDRVGWVEQTVKTCRARARPKPGGGGGGDDDGQNPAGCTKPSAAQRLVFSRSKYSNIRRHYRGALHRGWPVRLVVNRRGADARRDRLLEDIPTRDGFDRDEYPPAVGRGKGPGLERGSNPRGWKADVRYVESSENRSHGVSLGAKLRAFCNGTSFRDVFR
jgi:hypothetical protein